MGVDRTDYLFYGIDVGCDAVDYDRDEDVISGVPNAPFDMVYDGMSGKYAVAGKIVAKSDPHEGIEFIEVTPDKLPSDPDGLMRTISERFGPQAQKPRLFLFSHFH